MTGRSGSLPETLAASSPCRPSRCVSAMAPRPSAESPRKRRRFSKGLWKLGIMQTVARSEQTRTSFRRVGCLEGSSWNKQKLVGIHHGAAERGQSLRLDERASFARFLSLRRPVEGQLPHATNLSRQFRASFFLDSPRKRL